MFQDNDPPNRYEIPLCSICHNHLSEDIFNLACGHVFHAACISQQFEYKGICPNCQKRATIKEMRRIVYRVIPLVSKAEQKIDNVLDGMQKSEKEPFEAIVQEMKKCSEAKEKAQEQLERVERQNKKLQDQFDKVKALGIKDKKEVEVMRKENSSLAKYCQQTQQQLDEVNTVNLRFQVELQDLRKKEHQFSQYNRIKDIMRKSNSDLVKYKGDLQAHLTPAEEVANTFYEMLLMNRLELCKLKEKISEHPQRLQEKDQQMRKVRDQVDKYRADSTRNLEDREKYRRKYQEIKVKYRQLKDKCKPENCLDQPQFEDSVGFDSKNSKKQPSVVNFEEMQAKPLAQKKSVVTQSYGGFNQFRRKTDERPSDAGTLNGFLNFAKKR